MIRWCSAAFAPILLWCSASVHAADVATIDCVGKLLNPETAHSISSDFRTRIESAQTSIPDAPPQEGRPSDSAFRAEVDRAAMRCGEANGWTIGARAAASDYALKQLALPLFEAAVLDDGIDPGQIVRLSKGLHIPKVVWDEGPLPEHEKRSRIVDALSLRLLRAGVSLETPQQMRDVYALAIWLVELNTTQTDFIAA